MFSPVLAPNTPAWLLTTVLLLSFGSTLGLAFWATILEIRFLNPYTLVKTDNKEKWRKATKLALMQTALIPVFGLAAPFLSPLSGQFPMVPLFCAGIWILVLPFAILFKRWEFEWRINSYRYFDRQIKEKRSVYNRILANPLTGLMRLFLTADQKRFFSEGFPNDNYDRQDGETSVQESNTELR